MVVDQLNLERLGIPTLTIVTSAFVPLAKMVAAGESSPEFCHVVVPHPLGKIPGAEVERKAEAAFPEVLKLATGWRPAGAEGAAAAPVYPAGRFDFEGDRDDVDGLFREKGWSLGLPVIPPTVERVARVLEGTGRTPDEVLGPVPPRMGALTVELAAAHLVMAGGKPEYLPVLIAALEALLSPESNSRGSLATTGTTQMLVVVNGPVTKDIGLACGQGAAGKGHHANGAIGYAINLIAYAVGGSRPPLADRSTLGSPADYVCWVFGENEDKIPAGWQPFHVDRGFRKSDSVVTVMCCYPAVDSVSSSCVTPEEHARWFGGLVSPLLGIGGPCQPNAMKLHPVLALSHESAGLIAGAGWSKEDFRRAFWEEARTPLSAWPPGCAEMQTLRDMLGPQGPDSRIPVTLKPEQVLVLVAGGEGPHSHYFAPFIGALPVSRLVAR